MVELETLKLLVDLAVTGCLVYIGFKVLRLPESAKLSQRTVELEGLLKSLIKEADQAGSALNEQLRSRQSSLEKLLAEFEGSERRLKAQIDEAQRAFIASQAQQHSQMPPLPDFVQPQVVQKQVTTSQGHNQDVQNPAWQTQVAAPATPTRNTSSIQDSIAGRSQNSVQAAAGVVSAMRSASPGVVEQNDAEVPEPPSFETAVKRPSFPTQVAADRSVPRNMQEVLTPTASQPIAPVSTMAEAVAVLAESRDEQAQDSRVEKTSTSKLNIFGEPIGGNASEGEPIAEYAKGVAEAEAEAVREAGKDRDSATPLQAAIERESTPVKPAPVIVKPSQANKVATSYPVPETRTIVDDLYQAAEQMLRAGKDLQSVATQTKLPVDELRMLNQMIIREQVATASRLASQSRAAQGIERTKERDESKPVVTIDDPRLGALAATRQSDLAL